jgi:hypothetical protein
MELIGMSPECKKKLEPLMQATRDLVAAAYFFNVEQERRADSLRISAMAELDKIRSQSGEHIDPQRLSRIEEHLQNLGDKQKGMGETAVFSMYLAAELEFIDLLLNAAVDCECRAR